MREVDARRISLDRLIERDAAKAADGVEHRAVEQRGPVASHERVQSEPAALGADWMLNVGSDQSRMMSD